jgi:hypothetical protein
MHPDEPYAKRVLKAGAAGYMTIYCASASAEEAF